MSGPFGRICNPKRPALYQLAAVFGQRCAGNVAYSNHTAQSQALYRDVAQPPGATNIAEAACDVSQRSCNPAP